MLRYAELTVQHMQHQHQTIPVTVVIHVPLITQMELVLHMVWEHVAVLVVIPQVLVQLLQQILVLLRVLPTVVLIMVPVLRILLVEMLHLVVLTIIIILFLQEV